MPDMFIVYFLTAKRHIVDTFVSFINFSAQRKNPYIYMGIYVYGYTIKCK